MHTCIFHDFLLSYVHDISDNYSDCILSKDGIFSSFGDLPLRKDNLKDRSIYECNCKIKKR